MPPATEEALQIIRQLGLFRAGDLKAHGIPRQRIYELLRKGDVERQARGVYSASDHPYTENHHLAQVTKRVPGAVICLISALRFHELTTQLPHYVCIALPEKARKPRLTHPRLWVSRFSGPALTEGIEVHRIEGVDVRVYSATKTVADCFKYRNKVGIDVAMEAVRDLWRERRERRIIMDDISRYARICRVERVMRPYLEALVA